MAINFRLASDIRDSVIQGNLDGAREVARQLAFEDPGDSLPARWAADLDKMHAAAQNAAVAVDLPSAAKAVAELGATCGDCHSRLHSNMDERAMENGLPNRGVEDLRARMHRHQEAAQRLWAGLTIPSDAAWRGGARALTEAPVAPPQQDGAPIDRALNQSMQDVVALGRRALESETTQERIAAYSALLTACAGCHHPPG
jgi:cytochrome c553